MIVIGGILHIALGVFHLFFNKLFNYNNEIKTLTFINQRIALFLNIILTSFLFGVGIICITVPNDFTDTQIGIYFTILLAIVWIIRTILQVIYFPLKNGRSLFLFFIFLATSCCYLFSIDFTK